MKTVLDVLDLFGPTFAGPSWEPWKAFLSVIFALPLTEARAALAAQCTGRAVTSFTALSREAWMIVGRRGGKSRMAAFIAVFVGCFRPYAFALGERGVVAVITTDRRQSRVVFRYVHALLHAVPMLAAMIERENKDSIDLSNGITIEIHTASFRAVRGYTIVAVICDEIAFWPVDDAADPDAEILTAIRPAMATIEHALLVALSSPYARRGELWRTWQRHYGQDGDPVLVWQADSETMNPTLPAHIVRDAYAADPSAAASEYGAQFRTDIETFITPEALAAAIMPGRVEQPPLWGVAYSAFVDPAGGSGGDSLTLAISHRAGDRLVLDLVYERRPPFSPETTIGDCVTVLRRYGITRVCGDRYAGEFPREIFRKRGISYATSAKSKSDIYRDFLPLLNSGTVELLDLVRLRAQFAGLERRTARSGKDSIDHAPGGHDDVCNAAAGALTLLAATTVASAGYGYNDVI